MPTSKEYRSYADLCDNLADTAEDKIERTILCRSPTNGAASPITRPKSKRRPAGEDQRAELVRGRTL